MASTDDSVVVISESTVFPDTKSPITSIRLFVPEFSLLAVVNYTQRGCLFSGHPNPLSDDDLSHLKLSLSKALSVFPPLAGRLYTDPTTRNISVSCSDAGALFVHARATSLHLSEILDHPSPPSSALKHLFPLRATINYDGHTTPLAAVQVTELSNAVFIGFSVNHVVADATSIWNFFNTLADISRTGSLNPSLSPSFPVNADDEISDLGRGVTDDTLFPQCIAPPNFRPTTASLPKQPTTERAFHFSRQAMLALKKMANETRPENSVSGVEISSFQSLCALLWRSITRARKLPSTQTTVFIIPMNCRQRVNPKMDPLIFGNVTQIIKTTSLAGEVVSWDLGRTADLLHRGLVEHDDSAVRKRVEGATGSQQSFSFKKDAGPMIIIASSPRIPAYEADFGWGRPVAVKSGNFNMFDGQCTMFPGREGGGSVEMELTLAPETTAGLETDPEFMQYVRLGDNSSN